MPSISLTGLVEYWALDEASGTRFGSHSTKHLTDHNSVGSATGKIATAADFESGSSQYLSHAGITVASGWSVSLWFWAESLPAAYQGLFTRDDYPATPRHQTSIYINPGANLACYVAVGDGLDGGSAPNFESTGPVVIANRWVNVVCTYDAATGLIGYVGGAVEATGAINLGAISSASCPVNVGRDVLGDNIGGVDRFFDGLIDEVSLWQRALSASEVTWLFNGGAGRSYTDIYTEATGGAPKRYLLVA